MSAEDWISGYIVIFGTFFYQCFPTCIFVSLVQFAIVDLVVF